ncbi:hypothetical protein [Paraburkholderia rhynchosiae]|uniref:Uncharacterized protein n=1 Tax=Paraburkholderia rhynchosiae TaxID=487049 RepID=A0ABX4V1H1_9BURK|nr:hypothetical protein [Paraburkholderia rhynchosiae]PMS28998.1 hypothetical protein C0Z16_21520 [Paraburkholderia rhynchosiae]
MKRFARFVHIIESHYRVPHDRFHFALNRRCIVPLVALASNVGFKAYGTHATRARRVRALNAACAAFYG